MSAPNVHELAQSREDGAALLDDVHGFLGRFVAFPSEHAHVAVTLWAVHTHLVERFDSTPRLALLGPEKQTGKTRVLELLELVSAGAETLSDASAAYLYRRIGDSPVTVLLDECDAIWKRGKSEETAEALRSVVNAGHRRRATVGRVEMSGQRAALVRFPVYAPVALAGIGDCLPDTILDRAVIVRMRRRAPDEEVEDYRERLAAPDGAALHDRLEAWACTVAEKVGNPWPALPSGVSDRPADVWEPLLAVAALAGGTWPAHAEGACLAFVHGTRQDATSVGVRLLEDLLAVFCGGSGTDGTCGTCLTSAVPQVPDVPHPHARSTDDILTALHAMDEAPWRRWYGEPLNPRGLARLLKPYGVSSTKVRVGEKSVRGYRREDLWDTWRRYLTAAQNGSAPTACTACQQPLDPALAAAGQNTHPACDKPPL